MNTTKLFVLLMCVMFSTNAAAYGSSSSSKKACTKPKFTLFTPAHLSVVAPQSEFSFQASALTNPDSIEVSVKKQPVQITIKEINNSYSITGKLPLDLTDTYARVDIKATGTNKCKGTNGWLLKIESVKP